ncbi:SDR family NAD(P)-dependent oxidoreductase [Streptomyces sp. NPDC001705]
MSVRKKVLITGASSGLGEQMTRTLAASRCALTLCARRTDRMQRLRKVMVAAHPGYIATDLIAGRGDMTTDDHHRERSAGHGESH